MALVLVTSLISFLLIAAASAASDRATLLLYGQLAAATYNISAGQSDITLPGDYRITKSLFADETVSLFGKPHVLIGFTAVSKSTQNIAVVLRGTAFPAEWIKNILVLPVPFTFTDGHTSNSINVHAGFSSVYNKGDPSLRQQILVELISLVSSNPRFTISFAGHSLGGALAILSAFDVYSNVNFNSDNQLQLSVYTYGAPMVGDEGFRQAVSRDNGLHISRVSDVRDLVPYLPSLNYVHVGDELLVDGCALDDPKNKPNDTLSLVAMYHDIYRYLRTVGSLAKLESSSISDNMSDQLFQGFQDLVNSLINSISSNVLDFANLVTSLKNYLNNVSAPCKN